jgi:iron complex transport system substrate-binding protein
MSRTIPGFVTLAIVAAVLGATASIAAEVVDARGEVIKADNPSRILSIGGDTTEIVYALGFGSNVVAVDTSSQFPPEVLAKKKVGYMRALSTEGVLSTGATLILANAHAGPPEVIRALATSSVPLVMLPENASPESLIEKVKLVGRALGAEAKANDLAAQLNGQFGSLETVRSKIERPVRALLVLSVDGGRALAAGRGTTADLMLELAGATNAAADLNGYKPVSDEALIEMAPQAIIVARRAPEEEIAAEIAALPGFKALGAGRKVPIITMDAAYLLGFGPRAPRAAGELMAQLYPDLPNQVAR